MSLAELGFPRAAAVTTLLRRRISFFSGWDLVFAGEGFVPHRFSVGDGGSVASGVRLRYVLVDLFVKGSDLLCSPVSMFRVGGPFTGVGVVAGLVLPCRSASASGSLFLLSERSPRFFQRLKIHLGWISGVVASAASSMFEVFRRRRRSPGICTRTACSVGRTGAEEEDEQGF